MSSSTSHDTSSDSELLCRFVEKGDQTAFAALVEKHQNLVFSVCTRVLHNPLDIEDAFQNTFMILAKRAPSIKVRNSIVTWLFTVAQRASRAVAASNAKRSHAESNYVRTPAQDIFEKIRQQELLETVMKELAKLPTRYKAPLMLCMIGGLTRREAAEQLKSTESTIKARLSRGRELLKKRLRRHHVIPGIALGAISVPIASMASDTLIKQTISSGIANSVAHYSWGSSITALSIAMKEKIVGISMAIFHRPYVAGISFPALVCCVICLISLGVFRTPKNLPAATIASVNIGTEANWSSNLVFRASILQAEDEEEAMPKGDYTLAVYHGESPSIVHVQLKKEEGSLIVVHSEGGAPLRLEGKLRGRQIKLVGIRDSSIWGAGTIEYQGKLGEDKNQVVGKWSWKVDGNKIQSGDFKILPGKWTLGEPSSSNPGMPKD